MKNITLNYKKWLVLAATTVLVACTSTGEISSSNLQPSTASPAVIRYSTVHHPVIGSHGMVVSQNAVASAVGKSILTQGGNAVDAAVAVGFALAVTLPRAGNLGGSGFMLIHLADRNETISLDYRSAAPERFDPKNHSDGNGKLDLRQITFGPTANGVPGTVAGLHEAWSKFGSLSWQELIEPARQLALNGIVVTNDLAFALSEAHPILAQYPGSATAYLKPDGSSYVAGEILRLPDLAWCLEQIQKGGADAFYRGIVGDRIVESVQRDGGYLSKQDLANYQVKYREPIQGSYRGHRVWTMPPASGGGMTLMQMLNILENFELGDYQAGSSTSLHILAETMKRSAANRRVSIGDPDFVQVPIKGYVSKSLAADLAQQIDLNRATAVDKISPTDALPYESRETTHYSVMDSYGNAVSNTYTLGYSFGSGYAAPGTGIILDNQVRNFTYGKPGHANEIAPGKRMLSTMTPTIVADKDGKVMLVTGTPGGGRIINVILQLIVNVIDFKMNIAEATHAPRIHQQWRTPSLGVEKGIGPDTIALLKLRGHDIQQQPTMGSTQSILYKDGLFFGAADPRRPGALALGVNRNDVQTASQQ